jgi:hypothetical protein
MVAPAVAGAAKERLVAPETHLVFLRRKVTMVAMVLALLLLVRLIMAAVAVAGLPPSALLEQQPLAAMVAPEHHRQFLVRL